MKLFGYAPDLDTTTPGIIVECGSLVPSFVGYEAAPTPVNGTLATATGTVMGAATLLKLDGTVRVFYGNATQLFEASGTSWNEVTRGAGAYTTVTNRWRFAQFGNVSLAVSKENVLQSINAGADFADISGAPKADIVAVVNQFVMLFNTNEGTYGDSLNRWWCSAIGNETSWTPDAGTQATTGILTSTSGKITAAKKFGDQIVVYKRRGMYVGNYVGPPIVWDFKEVPSQTGTFSQESVFNIGTEEQPLHFFVGEDDFYLFDGAKPMAIGLGVKTTFFQNLNVASAEKICIMQDRRNSRLYIYYPSGSSTSLNACLVYHYKTLKWGVDDRSVMFAFEYIPSGVTYDNLGGLYSTYSDLPSSSYDNSFLPAQRIVPAIFSSGGVLQTMDGTPSSASMTLGDVGDDTSEYLLSRVKPKFLTAPTSATMTNYYRQSIGDSLTVDTTTTMASSRFDVLRSARWHRTAYSFTGNVKLNEVQLELQNAGLE
jgi:hypothetical protein